MLHLHFLGPPRIEHDGQPVILDTRKATALLAYLAVTGQHHSRDTLATLLYPETDQSRARAALRRTLSSLRTGIGEPWLAVERDSMALPSAPGLYCDVDQFQRLLAECHDHGHGEHDVCARCLGPLAEAVALYRDDFLAGFSLRDSAAFDEWQFSEAERLRRELVSALERLVRGLTVAGRLSEATEHAQRLLASDPLHEPAHRVLMLLYVWTGQTQNALRQYRECVRVLSEELGVGPLPETTRVFEAIKERRTPPPPAALRAASLRSAQQAPIPPLAPTPAPPAVGTLPLVGRAAELARLHQIHQEIRGDGRLAALEGEPGIGKTRLAEEFAAQVHADGGTVIAGRCYEGESGLAYGVLVEALRAVLARPELTQRLVGTPDHWLTEAARLLPELATGRSLPSPPPLDHPGAQAHFFEGLCQVIQALAGPAGVLYVDDAQWADGASLDALAYLAHRLAGRPLLVLLAWRSEDSPAVQRLRGLLRDTQRAGRGHSLLLNRLGRADVAILAAGLPGDHLTERLHTESEGLPLFVAEYLRAWQTGEAHGGEWPVPQGVSSLLHARLAAVDEAGQQLLATAAVIGRSFDFETLRATSGRSEEETVDCLEQLLRQGLVLERSDGYDFSHEQLRGLVYAETGLARRRLLHRRVAEALQRHPRASQAAGAVASQIGHHLQMAGQDAEAAGYFWQAGQHARALYANAEALAHFETALALGHPDTAALHEAIGDLHTLAGRYSAACTAYEQTAAVVTTGDQPTSSRLAQIERKLALVHYRQGDWALAESHFQAAQAGWPTGDMAGLAHVLADRSLNAHRQGQARRAEVLAEEALHEARQARDATSQTRAHNALGILARSRGDLPAAAAQLAQGLALAEALNDLAGRVAALNNLALVRQDQGDTTAAIQLTETALALCATQGDRHREAALRNNLADLLHAAGQPAAAMEQLKQAVAVFAEIGEAVGAPWQPEIWKLVEW
ncbi:MAG TPA: AAA family ATPase [Anaerolineae bacterium]|nr:AAA family ATPase [Anaerolineae bacterium]